MTSNEPYAHARRAFRHEAQERLAKIRDGRDVLIALLDDLNL